MIRNQTTDAWDEKELLERLKPFPHQMANVTEWLGEDPYMAGRRDGKTDIGALAAGQSSALIHDIKPAAEIVAELMEQASEALDRLLIF